MDMTVQGLSFQSFDAATTMGCNFARGEGEAPPALKVAVVYKKAIVTGRVGINGRLHGASENRAATGEEGKERGNKRYMECEMSARVSDLTVIVTIHAERRRRLDGGMGGGGAGGMGEWGPEPRGGESKMEDSAEEGWKEETESMEKAGEETPKWRKKAEEKGEEETKDPKEEVLKDGEWKEAEDKGAEGWKESQSEEEEWDTQEHSVEEGWKEEKPEIGQEWRREEVPPVSKMAPDPVGAFETVAKTGKLEEREGEKISAYHQRDEPQIRAPSNQIEPPEEGDERPRESTRVPRVAWGTNPREQGEKRAGEAWRGEEEEGLGWTEGGARGRVGRRDEAKGGGGGRRVEKWEEGRGLGSGEGDTLGMDAEKWGGKGEGGGKVRSGWVGSVKELGWGEEAEETAASRVSGNRKAKEDDWEPVIGSKAPRSWQAERPESSATEGGKLQGTRSEALREWGGPRGEEDRRGRSWEGSKNGGSSQGKHRGVRGGPIPHGNPHSGYREKWPVLIRGPGVPVEASGRGGGPTGVGAERRTWDEKPKAERRRERWPVFESRPPDKWAVNWVTGERNRGSTPGRDSQGPHPGQHEHHGPPGARGDTAKGPFLESRVRSQHPGSRMGARQSPHPSRYPARSEEGSSDHSHDAGFFGGQPPSGKRYRRSTEKYNKPEKKAEFKVLEELKKDPWWSGKHAYQKDANTRDSERRAFIDLLTKMTEQQGNSEALVGMDDIQVFELHPHRENITRGSQRESQNSELLMQAKYNVKPLLAKEDENLTNGTNVAWSNIQEKFGHKIKLGFSHFGGGNRSVFNAQVEEGRRERRKRSGDQLGGLESLKHARSPILMKSESFMVGLPLIRFSGCTEDFGWLKQSWESESQFHGNSQVRGPDPLRLKQEMEGLFYGGVKRMIGMFSERTVRGILAEDLATKLGFIVSYG
ncbi:filaggrin-like [Ischnura elegans]|uniref:filaggrin-like n=1 Tax=Ischnura elegans TaxID=197161 RepID=UPI001ED8815C|nr:filaggrin-like [Ischnura elegans]